MIGAFFLTVSRLLLLDPVQTGQALRGIRIRVLTGAGNVKILKKMDSCCFPAHAGKPYGCQNGGQDKKLIVPIAERFGLCRRISCKGQSGLDNPDLDLSGLKN